jgi:hypothetical protein
MSHIDEQNESTKGGVDDRGTFSFDNGVQDLDLADASPERQQKSFEGSYLYATAFSIKPIDVRFRTFPHLGDYLSLFARYFKGLSTL